MKTVNFKAGLPIVANQKLITCVIKFGCGLQLQVYNVIAYKAWLTEVCSLVAHLFFDSRTFD